MNDLLKEEEFSIKPYKPWKLFFIFYLIIIAEIAGIFWLRAIINPLVALLLLAISPIVSSFVMFYWKKENAFLSRLDIVLSIAITFLFYCLPFIYSILISSDSNSIMASVIVIAVYFFVGTVTSIIMVSLAKVGAHNFNENN